VKYANKLYAVPIGSTVVVNGISAQVIGKFQERYVFSDGSATTYALALRGENGERMEVGEEQRGGKSYLWTSGYKGTRHISSFLDALNRLDSAEVGQIYRDKHEGECEDVYANWYAFGSKDDQKMFLVNNFDTFDVWHSETIQRRDIKLPN
jgi:hypothetical protein